MSSRLDAIVQRLVDVLTLDWRDHGRLKGLLESQFTAALGHQARGMADIAQQIVTLVQDIEARRPQRDELLQLLMGRQANPGLLALVRRLPSSLSSEVRARLDDVCRRLEAEARECKRLNLRNCELIHEQHALMKRMMGLPETCYA